jgi:hypothetical protein
MGSVLYQVNQDPAIATPTAIPSLRVKAGISYMAENGADVSLFDAYQAHIGGVAASIDPQPDAFHSVSAHLRFDLTKHWLKNGAQGFALFLHADNLMNAQVWLPAVESSSPNTMPAVRRRTLYFGLEVWRR